MDIRHFSPNQREVVEAGDGPLSILAGPGSGKTTVLAGRVAYLVEQRGVAPATILAITFTTAAAATLRQRLAGVLGDAAQDLTITTFHALGLRLIKQWSGELGFGDGVPAVYGRDDARLLLREVASGFGLELATEAHGRDTDPWSQSLSKLTFALDRFRLGWSDRRQSSTEQDDIDEELLRSLSTAYEAQLQQRGAVDFASMLTLPLHLFESEPVALRVVQDAYRFVMADEFQDTSDTEFKLLRQVVKRHRNLAVVGDPNQCFPPGTAIQTPTGPEPIESLRTGDAIVAAAGDGQTIAARVQQVFRREFDGDLVRVTLKSGNVVRMTREHMCFARLGLRHDIFYVYLMYRNDLGYRVGITKGAVYAQDVGAFVPGLRFRTVLEHADKAWILRVCSTLEEAAFHEQLFSLRYGLPRVVFNAAGRKLTFDQPALERLYAAIDTRTNATRLMADVGLLFAYPHHRPQAHVAEPRTHRLQVHFTLFGGNQGGKQMPWRAHRVWLNSTDRATEHSIQRRGYQTRPGAANTWRAERQFLHAEQAMTFAEELAKSAESPEVAYWARLSKGRKFAFQPASQLRPAMIVPVLDGETIMDDEIISVEYEHYRGVVYDLNVDHLHNYVADGMVVHNCVYGWRGADPSILLDFARQYPEARVFPLDQNHRSTGVVVALSNALAAPLQSGRECWTSNAQGPRARLYAANDEVDEALFVAAEIQRLLEAGQIEHPGEVAVLFRTNVQAKAVALRLRAAGLPFRVRSDADLFAQPEVRDVVAYLRLAHSPTDGPALARVVNVPPRRLRAIEQALRKRAVPVPELPVWAQKRGGPTARRSVEELLAMLDELQCATRECRPAQALGIVLERTAYQGWLETQKDGTAKLHHLEELQSVMEGSPASDLATWLIDMHLGEVDGPAFGGTQATLLSTIHGAKGGEWPVVFVIGCEEGLLPHGRPTPAGQPTRAADEERRLAYVAFSRAQVLLYLVYSQARRLPSEAGVGRLEPRHPSRFLITLPPQLIERVNRKRVA